MPSDNYMVNVLRALDTPYGLVYRDIAVAIGEPPTGSLVLSNTILDGLEKGLIFSEDSEGKAKYHITDSGIAWYEA